MNQLVTVFGGSGFVGRHVVRALIKRGWRVRVAVRRPDLAFHLQPIGRVGQIQAVQSNLRYPASVAAALQGADAAINLVGIGASRGRQNFEAVHVFGARAVARAVAAAGISHFVHMSALGADAASDSAYAASKARGEEAVKEAVPQATIVRPSFIFGPEDTFFNRHAAMARLMPVLPLIGAESRSQPVFAGDVAEAIAKAVSGEAKTGVTYELGGPEVKTGREIVEFVCAATGRKRVLLPLSPTAASLLARVTEIGKTASLGLLPDTFYVTGDQVKMLQRDNLVSATAAAEGRTLEGLSLQPSSIESIVPSYLVRFRKTGQFDHTRIA
ncbi:complex I NDUFA9 subunit family protein [Methylovirgula sp. 4M-Z18]|uniref:complex I NDUFA9 subunit family protein n=1 Tax=Methylovirgula sp. 4M-Z18 TaxID=2293567 RepID=UPI001FE1D5ED|nr:complex I NDUFA9 subunit family protein [Methylovirgula sp. 4M-Z18]